MKMMVKAAIAALAMVTGAQQAQAVQWVEYTLSGYGTLRTSVFGQPDRFENAAFTAVFTIDRDVTPAGEIPLGRYVSTGETYRAQRLDTLPSPVTEDATYSNDYISGVYTNSTNRSETRFSATTNGSMAYYSVVADQQGGRQVVGSADTLRTTVREVADWRGYTFAISDVVPLPEPATWGLMLVGFAMTGAAMRRRPSPVLA